MESYELVVILSGKTTAAKKKKFIEKIEKLIKVSKGKVADIDDWGKHEFEYEIKGQSVGYFLIFNLELDQGAAKLLPPKLNLDEEVVRYLLVKK